MDIIPIVAAISGESVVNAVIWIVVAALIYFVVMWGIEKIGIPEPFHKIAIALVVLMVVVLLVNALLTIAGHPFIRW
jgi:hypothetical protein